MAEGGPSTPSGTRSFRPSVFASMTPWDETNTLLRWGRRSTSFSVRTLLWRPHTSVRHCLLGATCHMRWIPEYASRFIELLIGLLSAKARRPGPRVMSFRRRDAMFGNVFISPSRICRAMILLRLPPPFRSSTPQVMTATQRCTRFSDFRVISESDEVDV